MKRMEAEALTRFSADLAALHNPQEKLGIAVSGGPDSLALLLLTREVLGDRVFAATIDHGLRETSADEARMVAEICAGLGVPHEIIAVKVPAGNLQASAREARYLALEAWCVRHDIGALATAHHADDQAETLLMRLNRGSGLAGLAAIRASTTVPGGTRRLIRPLLSWRKAELEDIVGKAGLSPAQDPSNTNLHFDRVRMREALKTADWLDVRAIGESAAHLAEVQQMVEAMAEEEMRTCLKIEKEGMFYCISNNLAGGAYRPLLAATTGLILAALGADARGSEVARLVDRLLAGKNASLGGVLATPKKNAEGVVWHFAPEPKRREN